MKTLKSFGVYFAVFFMASCTKDHDVAPAVHQPQQTIAVPNGDFESWTYLKPDSWTTNSCPACAPPYETYIVRPDSDSYQGVFAAKFIYNNVYPAYAQNEFPVSIHPTNLTAFVKCNLYGMDTVTIKITLRYHSVAVDSGQWFGTASIGSYSQVNIPVTHNSFLVDSATILIQGGHQIGYPANNTELWVDNVELH